MTPMQKLKPQFDQLKRLLGTAFKEITLNKSEYKEEYIGCSDEKVQYINKGVKSDFIRLYKLQLNKENTTTLAFSFNYIKTEGNQEIITFSFSTGKEDKNFSKIFEMNTEECREHLNNINIMLKSIENVSNNEILKIVKEEFLGSNYELNYETKKKKIR